MNKPEIVIIPKSVIQSPAWSPRSNHAGHLVATANLLDSSFVTIPGVTLQLEIKAPVIVESCFYLFSIMRHAAKRRWPVFQLEVAPEGKRTHNGIPPIYGPHLHCGDDEPIKVLDQNVRCGNWSDSLKWFLEQANIASFSMDDPEHVEL